MTQASCIREMLLILDPLLSVQLPPNLTGKATSEGLLSLKLETKLESLANGYYRTVDHEEMCDCAVTFTSYKFPSFDENT